jgi:hypothetical protein
MLKNKKEALNEFSIKSVNPRYINIKENIYEALSNDALSVYLALRFEGDYSRDSSNIDKNIQFLCNKARVGKTRCKECLDELEFHGLILRELNPGYQSTYWVAQDLNYFTKDIHIPVQEVHDPSRTATDPSRTATDPSRTATDINTNSFTNSSKDCIPTRETSLITQLITVNPFDLPKSLIEDWLAVRAKKKTAVTPTAWTRLMSTLQKCREAGYDPTECFGLMVENGWNSLRLEWIENQKKERKQNTSKQTQSRTEQQHDSSWLTPNRLESLERAYLGGRKKEVRHD